MGAHANPSSSHRRRRMMADINVVPYIDVTLVLLIIFMVTAPMIVTGTIDLPKVSQASQAPIAAVEVRVREDGSLTLRKNVEGATEAAMSRDALAAAVKNLAAAMDTPVIISAERAVRYEHVVAAMDVLAKAGFTRVGLNVRME